MAEKWCGIFKVLEEMGELQQVLGKLCVFPDGNHIHQGDLVPKLVEEISDLYAALYYFTKENDIYMDSTRYLDKLNKFSEWGLSGIKDG